MKHNPGDLTSEFTIVAVIRDPYVGQRTFSNDELRSTITDQLAGLHLEVEAINVTSPKYQERSAIHVRPFFCPRKGRAVVMNFLIGAVVIVAFYTLLCLLQRYLLTTFAVVCVTSLVLAFIGGAYLLGGIILGKF